MLKMRRGQLFAALGAALVLPACSEAPPTPEVQPVAQVSPETPRPRDATANLPSDTGSQTTLPSGAVTGAGQPQGTTRQADVGAPGGLERQARTDARQEGAAEAPAGATGAAPGSGAGAATGASPGSGAGGVGGPAVIPGERLNRAPRAAKG